MRLPADRRRRAIVRGAVGICRELGIEVIAEGIETVGELHCLQDCGIDLIQGFLLARPTLGAIATADQLALPCRAACRAA